MKIFMLILIPLSWIYTIVISIRNWCYDVGIMSVEYVDVPVISVGNMTTGGTGKTPFVEFLLRYFMLREKKLAVLSRGYGRKARGTIIVSDGVKVYGTPETVGDEPYLIAKKYPSVIVIVDEKRPRAARLAVSKFRCDIIVLDDGFQHRKLGRDIDILMIDGKRPLQQIRLLPAGHRREPLSAARRAHIIAQRKTTHQQSPIQCLLSYDSKPTIQVRLVPIRFHQLFSSRIVSLADMKNKSCIAFCGIGNPISFKQTLNEIGMKVLEFLIYRDHYLYNHHDLETMANKMRQFSAQYIILTEKDAVRLQPSLLPRSLPIDAWYILEMELAIDEGESILKRVLDPLLKEAA